MKFSDQIKNEDQTESVDIAAALASWPVSYYEEKEPLKRLELLEASIKAGCDPEGDAIRKVLFDRRYEENRYANGGLADVFMRCFMDFLMISRSRPGKFGIKKARKKVLDWLKVLGFEAEAENPGLYNSILLSELCHLGQLYIALSADSKEYKAFILGIGKVSDRVLVQRLHNDLAAAGIDVADQLDLHSEMKLWLRALEEARVRMLPDSDPLRTE